MKVLAGLHTAALKNRLQGLARRAWIRRRLEHDDLALAETRRDLGRGTFHDREIRLAMGGQRGRERNQDGIDVPERVVVSRRRNTASVDESFESRGRNVADVAFAPVDAVDDLLVHIDEHDFSTGVREHPGKGHPDVPGTHDGNVFTHARTRLLRRSRRYTTHPLRAVSSAG